MVSATAGMTSGTTIQGRHAYVLGAEIAAGGEGRVHALSSHPDRYAKIYNKPLGASGANKLERLIQRNRPELDSVTAWPSELIRLPASGDVVGLVMPAVTAKKPLHLLATPSDRRREFPQASYRNLVAVAANVAKTVAILHHLGLIIGDLSATNILVDTHSDVRFIDCDSFSFAGQPSRVALPERIPPELQDANWSNVVRTTDHDAFALAVLVHELLYFGRHPYGGHPTLDIADAIRTGNHGLVPSHARALARVTGVPLDEVVGVDVRDLFVRAFSSTPRPTAHDWMMALQRLFQGLTVCPTNTAHSYPGSACPWCRIEHAGKPTGFAKTPGIAPAQPQPAPTIMPAAHPVAAQSLPGHYRRQRPVPRRRGMLDRIRDVLDTIADVFEAIRDAIVWIIDRRKPIALTGVAMLFTYGFLAPKTSTVPASPPASHVGRETDAERKAIEKRETRERRIETQRQQDRARQEHKAERDRIRQSQRRRADDERDRRSEGTAPASAGRTWGEVIVFPGDTRHPPKHAPVQPWPAHERRRVVAPPTYELPRRSESNQGPRPSGDEIERFFRRLPGSILRLLP